jgi:hypothetical protein
MAMAEFAIPKWIARVHCAKREFSGTLSSPDGRRNGGTADILHFVVRLEAARCASPRGHATSIHVGA